MAAYIRGQSKNFSSSGSLEDFQFNQVRSETNKQNLEILSDSKNIWNRSTSIPSSNNLHYSSDLNSTIKSCDQKDEKVQSELNCANSNNSVIPRFNVGGIVSAHYQSQPNLNDTVDEYEETNATNFVRDSRSYSVHPHSKSIEASHCIHDQISRTNLACVIQDAIEKSCNLIQVDSSGFKNKSRRQLYSDTLNVSSHSVDKKTCDLKENCVGGSIIEAKQSVGPSTIVVMMNGNSTQIYPSFNYDNDKLSGNHLNHRINERSNTNKHFASKSTSAEKYNSNMAFSEQENNTPQSDMEFDIERKRHSSQSGFKSSFAQEVEENLRNSSSFAGRNQQNRHFFEPALRSSHLDGNVGIRDTFPRSLVSPSSSGGRLSRDDGASLTSGYFDSSSIDFNQDEIFGKDRRSYSTAFDITKMPSIGNQEQIRPSSPSNDNWMTSTEFVKLLEEQEANENTKIYRLKSNDTSSNMADKGNKFSRGRVNNSYLDKEAKIPFKKLKKTCTDLGFTFSDQEWKQLALSLNPNSKHDMPFNESIKLMKENNSTVCNDNSVEPDITVRNGDFFAALHLLMKHKHHITNDNRTSIDNGHKCSMKSDSGGEMESCRSSDSETIHEPSSLIKRGRPLHSKSAQRSSISSEDSTGRSKLGFDGDMSFHKTLDQLTDQLAERDTELLRTKMECQRLNQLVIKTRSKSEDINDEGSKYNQHRKRNLELEKEVDNLKWQLNAMESSRKTYEEATQRLVSFLEQVTTVLQGTSPVQRKLLESTRAEVSKVARRARIQGSQPYIQRAAKRFSLDSVSQASLMSRAESMPGLTSGLGGSLLSLSTNTTDGGNSPLTAVTNKKFSRKTAKDALGREIPSARDSMSSRNSSDFSSSNIYYEKSGYKTLPSHYASSSNFQSSSGKSKQRIKRSQSTSSGAGHTHVSARHNNLMYGIHSRTQSPMPSLKEHESQATLLDDIENTSNIHSTVLPEDGQCQNHESRKSRNQVAYANNDIINQYAKSSSLKSSRKRISPSRSKSSSRDKYQSRVVSSVHEEQIIPLHYNDTNDSSQRITVNANINNLVETNTKDGSCNSTDKKISKKNLKQVIKIGNISHDFANKSGRNTNEDGDNSVPSNSSGPVDYVQETSARKFIPRRSASTVSISNDSCNAAYQMNEERRNEIIEEDIHDSKHPNENRISARFSIGSETSKAIYRKNSHSASKCRDRSISPPPMPIEAVVQVLGTDEGYKEMNESAENCSKISLPDKPEKQIQESPIKLPADSLSNNLENENMGTNKLSNATDGSKISTMQVLVSSNSNNPAALRSETKLTVESGQGPLLKDQIKFKSLGDLHMEKGLPSLPRTNPSQDHRSNKKSLAYDSEDPNGSSSSVVRDRLASNAHKLLRSMKQLLAREKTVNITGSGSSNCPSQIAGETSKSGVVIKSSRLTDNSTRLLQDVNKTTNNSTEYSKPVKTGTKISNTNISKIQLNQEDSLTEQVTQAFPYDPRVNLQLLSTMSFPGLPSYPVLAASKSSPWNC